MCAASLPLANLPHFSEYSHDEMSHVNSLRQLHEHNPHKR